MLGTVAVGESLALLEEGRAGSSVLFLACVEGILSRGRAGFAWTLCRWGS